MTTVHPGKIDELRRLLIGPEHEKLEEISSRVERTELRALDVAEVLPESIAASARADSRLIGALRGPLRQCVSESVRENPDEYADALFPVMGPAIRRAVAEAFKGWIQQANKAIEQSLSARGLHWRFQAWRAGIPFGEYVLQRTLLYRVEHVYLIQSQSGLLIAHVQQGNDGIKDDDAVSAMFTAIQEFVKDSFVHTEPQRLRTAELADLVLWAVHGPSCILVAVIRGSPPETLRADLESALEHIETANSRALREYDGDRAAMVELEPEIRKCLLSSSRSEAVERSRQRWSPAFVAATVAAVAIAIVLGARLLQDSRARDAVAALNTTAGIVVTDFERHGATLIVRGLRDPSATPPEQVVAGTAWRGTVETALRPFLSLEPTIVLARARTRLAAPATVALGLDAGTLRATGTASAEWLATAAAAQIPGVDAVDLTGVALDPNERLARLKALLAPPADVTLTLENDTLAIAGHAPHAWIVRARDAIAGVADVKDLETSGLVEIEREAMRAIEARVVAAAIAYDIGSSTAAPTEREKLAPLAAALREHADLARAIGAVSRLTVTGHTLDNGAREVNVLLERARAGDAATSLRAAGVPASMLIERSSLESGEQDERGAQVTFRLESIAQDGAHH
jgi:OOP family OmpA-OmpF porin